MRYCRANVGRPDPRYGGVLTDISTLPVGTTFYVRNGAWYGKIVDLDGAKGVQTSSKPFVGDRMPPHRKPVKLFPAGSDDNVLSLSDVRVPEDAHARDADSWGDPDFILETVRSMAATFLTTPEGLAETRRACEDFNWGDLMSNLPLVADGMTLRARRADDRELDHAVGFRVDQNGVTLEAVDREDDHGKENEP